MFRTYLGRELKNRRRQTIIIAIGMALAIALVVVVNAVAGGVQNAQASALSSVYGVGTDITVTKAATKPSGNPGQQFKIGSGQGQTKNGTKSFSSSQLQTPIGTTTFSSSAVTKAASTTGVKAATGVLSLSNTSFTGKMPTSGTSGSAPSGSSSSQSGGSSSFGVSSTTVLGYDVTSSSKIGPLTSTTLKSGRLLTSADKGDRVALLDSNYATTAKKKVGSTITLGGKSFKVVGIVKSTSTSSTSASNVYIPLDTAQTLANLKGKVTSVYVQATSSTDISSVQTALTKSLGSSYTVNTQASLASTVSGSLSTTASLASSLGLWLSILVLAAAFLIAVLFTVSGVSRRTREFGTLKAIGWSNRRVVGQVAGESLVQGLIGGAVGIVIGLAAIVVVNFIHPTLTASTTASSSVPGGGPSGMAQQASSSASTIALTLPVSASVIALAVGLSVLGGLIAGAFGGWRATSLRPAEALRSVA